jgi:hypothetical protein
VPDMSQSQDRLTRIARRQNLRAKGDVVFSLLYVSVGLGNLALLLSL